MDWLGIRDLKCISSQYIFATLKYPENHCFCIKKISSQNIEIYLKNFWQKHAKYFNLIIMCKPHNDYSIINYKYRGSWAKLIWKSQCCDQSALALSPTPQRSLIKLRYQGLFGPPVGRTHIILYNLYTSPRRNHIEKKSCSRAFIMIVNVTDSTRIVRGSRDVILDYFWFKILPPLDTDKD